MKGQNNCKEANGSEFKEHYYQKISLEEKDKCFLRQERSPWYCLVDDWVGASASRRKVHL
jgi:hypothetical protein